MFPVLRLRMRAALKSIARTIVVEIINFRMIPADFLIWHRSVLIDSLRFIHSTTRFPSPRREYVFLYVYSLLIYSKSAFNYLLLLL